MNIKFDYPDETSDDKLISDMFEESTTINLSINKQENIFCESVFQKGHDTIKPIEEQWQVIKDILDESLKRQEKDDNNKTKNKTKYKFDPYEFFRNTAWRELELRLCKVFGFGAANVEHWNEKYLSKSPDKDFESKELNAITYTFQRYPIDGLLTEKGFYDETHSLKMHVSFSLGIIKYLSAEELTAVLLHELGHNIDPALVDIKYAKTNDLVDYLISKRNTSNDGNAKDTKKHSLGSGIFVLILLLGYSFFAILIYLLERVAMTFPVNVDKIANNIKKYIRDHDNTFNIYQSTEAFADNLPRMYGYGPALISAFKIMGGYLDKQVSRIKNANERDRIVASIISRSLKDVHRTDIHRYYNLLKEYEKDLDDPRLPKEVKKQIKEDRDRLEALMNEYLNSGSNLKKKLNKLILTELQAQDETIKAANENDKKEDKKEDKKDAKPFKIWDSWDKLFSKSPIKMPTK